MQKDKPVYNSGGDAWWGEVIRMTAIGAGADLSGMFNVVDLTECGVRRYSTFVHIAVNRHIDEITPRLLRRFASKEGYKLFDDSVPCRKCCMSLMGPYSLLCDQYKDSTSWMYAPAL